ncbi:sensor histidine kinase [Novosphingobium cyanobacteriorum]|uniref:Two-component regulator propeller domain-containing protein n=1 Tax=Novosphingobium cyanobacteriorum TaxID=3024215 RepID=A0ABT6CCQ7_9SPHN|nr:sensor histidine kinase [Novosphingobium cyanobacteriorum]MDF8331717.1 two-component regulator propeller domain-containing protein [Novosphingobium cyanobacteriorum]
MAAGLLLLVQFNARAASDRPAADALRGFRITHWSLEEGAPSRINSITQSADGMLWIGGVDGLFRFDGVTFEKVESRRRLVVAQVLAARSGKVWVGLARGQGLLVYREGALRPSAMPNPSREVNDIAEDRDGAIWVARGGRSVRSLARYSGGRWQEFDAASGLPDQPVWNLLVARDGTLWVVLEHAIYRRRPGAERFEPTGLAVPPRSSLAEDPDGGIWLSDRLGIRRVAVAGSGAIMRGPLHRHPEPAGGTRTLFDRHGDLWEATWSDGVVRVINPLGNPRKIRVARLDMTLGLLSDQTRAIFRDREGNVWVGTELGLNMLRRVPITAPPGIPVNSSSSYRLALAADGTVFAAEASGVYRIAGGAEPLLALRTDSPVDALCRSASGGVWVVTGNQVIRLARGQRAASPKPTPFTAQACAEDAMGRLWLPALDKGLFVFANGRWTTWPGLGPGIGVPGNVAILPDGRPVIHFRNGVPSGPVPFVGIDERSAPSEGIEGMLMGQGTVLVSGAAGLAAPFLPGRPLLDKARYPWAASLNGLAEGPSGYTWAVGDEGVVRLRTADLARALAHPGAPVPTRLFDFRDGLNSFVQKGGGDQIVVGGDGRVWFATRRNVLSIDPGSLSVNRMPPSVQVRTIQAGARTLNAADGLQLPAGTTRVEIGFTAPSLSVPQRVTFRFRLNGADGGWTTVRNVRRAVFSDLGPGDYTFEVLAANEDGAWSARPARLRFQIARAFHQTWWFRVTAALVLLGLLYAGFSLRLSQVSGQIQQRMLARTHERERIARELHDTMIQGVQGLIMRFQSVADRFADDPRAQAVLVPALDRAEEMLVEGRERVSGLRRADERDFVREVQRLTADEIYPAGLIGPLVVRGRPHRLLPELVDEVLAVICEALNNAACHSGATRVDVGVVFGPLRFTVFVRDNGVGISPDFVSPKGRPGHYGLLGIYERARAMKGKLRIESAEGFGTEIRLKVPARFAYLPDGIAAR